METESVAKQGLCWKLFWPLCEVAESHPSPASYSPLPLLPLLCDLHLTAAIPPAQSGMDLPLPMKLIAVSSTAGLWVDPCTQL